MISDRGGGNVRWARPSLATTPGARQSPHRPKAALWNRWARRLALTAAPPRAKVSGYSRDQWGMCLPEDGYRAETWVPGRCAHSPRAPAGFLPVCHLCRPAQSKQQRKGIPGGTHLAPGGGTHPCNPGQRKRTCVAYRLGGAVEQVGVARPISARDAGFGEHLRRSATSALLVHVNAGRHRLSLQLLLRVHLH